MMAADRRALQGHAAMLVFSASVAGSYALGATVAHVMPPVALQAMRFMLGGVLMGALAALGPGLRRSDFQAPWRYVQTGGVFASYFVLMFESLKTATPISIAAVFTLAPLITAGFGWMLMRQRVGPRMAMALIIGALGALWVIFRGDLAALVKFDIGRGEAIFLIGVVLHSLFVPLSQKLSRGEHVLVQTFGVLCGGSLVLALFGGNALLHVDWSTVPPRLFWVMGYLVVFSTMISFLCLQFSGARLPAAKVMAYGYLVPSWVMLWEIALGNDVPPARALIGLALSLVAMLMLLRRDDPVPQ